MHGGALPFNGATHAITIADDSRLRIDTATFAVWVRIDQLPSGGDLATIAGKTFGAGESNTWELFLDHNAAVELAAGGDAGTTTYALTPWTPAADTWVHLAMTWSGNGISLFVDGNLAATAAPLTTLYDDGELLLGADRDTGLLVNRLSGSLDDVRLYVRVLEDAEIAALAQRP